ncbi:MAG: response regulator [Candidatus Binatia bacterium]
MSGSILLVDDDSLSRRNIALFLRRAGYMVLEANSGEHGLDLIRTIDNFALVISDLRMEGMANGIDVLACQAEVSPKAATILITAFGSAEVKEEATALGALYIEKPIHLEDLLVKISHLLSTKRTM